MCLTDLQVAQAMARERARMGGAPGGGAARGLPRHIPTRDPTPRRAFAFTGACLAVLLIVLVGCGGDDGLYGGGEETTATAPATAAGSDEDQIENAIEGVLVSGDPKLACDQFVTQAYLSETYGDKTACEQSQAPGSSAKSVKVSGIEVDGEKAKAVAVPKGGPTSGDRLRIQLVLEDGTWKVDSLRSNAPVGP